MQLCIYMQCLPSKYTWLVRRQIAPKGMIKWVPISVIVLEAEIVQNPRICERSTVVRLTSKCKPKHGLLANITVDHWAQVPYWINKQWSKQLILEYCTSNRSDIISSKGAKAYCTQIVVLHCNWPATVPWLSLLSECIIPAVRHHTPLLRCCQHGTASGVMFDISMASVQSY